MNASSDYWRLLVSATPEEKRRGQALSDAVDHCRLAAAALQAAREGETNQVKIAVLDRALETVLRTQRELEALQ